MPNNSTQPGIVILGLGPGDPAKMTKEALDWLEFIPEVYLRTRQHPLVASFPAGLQVYSFDDLYEKGDSFEAVYSQIVERVLELGQRPQGVTYAVPGHPYVAEATAPEIRRRAAQMGIAVRVIDGMSFLEPVFSALEIDPFPRLTLIDALELASLHTPNFPPDAPVLITQIYDRLSASGVKLTLNAVYPDEHPVILVHAAGTAEETIERLPLYEIDRSAKVGLLSALYVPALSPDSSLESFQEVIARLRAPDGCPWDREQTHLSLRKYLIEETFEVVEALDQENMDALCEELGDLLLQVVLHAQIALEDGDFDLADVLAGINRKLVRRHPHVFANTAVDGVEGVLANWQKIKAEEHAEKGDDQRKGVLDGIPPAMPALICAQELQSRAARVGFDWGDVEPVMAKVEEELEEVRTAESAGERVKELGDLLFAVVNLVRWYDGDAEAALRQTNGRFQSRFAYIEAKATEAGRDLNDMSLAEMDVFWDEAKRLEK